MQPDCSPTRPRTACSRPARPGRRRPAPDPSTDRPPRRSWWAASPWGVTPMSRIHVRLLSSAAILVALAAAPSGAWAKGGGGGGGGGGAGGGGPVRLGTTIVEGPITAINPAAGTITVAGALVKVPADG